MGILRLAHLLLLSPTRRSVSSFGWMPVSPRPPVASRRGPRRRRQVRSLVFSLCAGLRRVWSLRLLCGGGAAGWSRRHLVCGSRVRRQGWGRGGDRFLPSVPLRRRCWPPSLTGLWRLTLGWPSLDSSGVPIAMLGSGGARVARFFCRAGVRSASPGITGGTRDFRGSIGAGIARWAPPACGGSWPSVLGALASALLQVLGSCVP